ncbi:MAG: hypothetical protein GC201_17510 [Alphaproteobacteria bacterium]|nr:hypothetical protein [Alphaproteobacteria bacterium]
MEAHASPALRARLRRSLIQLGGLLAIALLVVGVLAMFSVWSLNRVHVQNYAEASEALFALNDGRSAQTLFKIQVQEWKNVLLRGADPKDYQHHLQAFEHNEALVQHHLQSLARRAETLGMPDVAREATSLALEHEKLGALYRSALKRGRAGDWDPFAIDRSVRGIDRHLNAELDRVAQLLLNETERRRILAANKEEDRYETLSTFLGWSIAIAIVGLVLWTALRRPSGLA